jgi:rhamnose utilization protein RhaD (predicted bifunctional aldolase and dehydrogenase)
MVMSKDVLAELVALSQSLGDPSRDLVILGEGNTSAKVDETYFYVKGSGKELRTADESSFVPISLPRVLSALEHDPLNDQETRTFLLEAKMDPATETMPSLETFLHAYLLSLQDIRFVGHTHPTAVNAILCSMKSSEVVRGRLFPDEIVCCGPVLCYVEYADPGIPLARQLRRRVKEFIDEQKMPPKVILMENHGLIACGGTTREVETITSMYVKAARILLGTYGLGGPRFLSPEQVDRIYTRPDELYRQKLLAGKG